jgi:ribonuclease P protein component
MDANSQPRLRYPKAARLGGKVAFAAVYDARVKSTGGPLVFFSRPNGLSISRIGLSVSRKVGTAPHRNRIKRRLREAFRLSRAVLPCGFDLVIVVRPHKPLSVVEYQARLVTALNRAVKSWNAEAGTGRGTCVPPVPDSSRHGRDARAAEDPPLTA